jgi:endonuclease YncB( thermonuclease family)
MRSLNITVILLLGTGLRDARSDDKKSTDPGGKPTVVRELITGPAHHPKEKILRITGKVKVIDANTVLFKDGTKVEIAGTIDAPAPDQKGFIDGKFYPAGKEAAKFLQEMIGEKTVTFYAWGDGSEREPGKLRGRCFVGETELGLEMVRNGWAVGDHSTMMAYEIIARENKRGLWRGQFVIPERWRKGERLKDE